jgi:predicted CXXCH cytochrome family protein
MKKVSILRFFFVLILILFIQTNAISQSVVNTVHNLSTGGPGNTKSLSEDEICIFCHTPHTGSTQSPLWNKGESGSNYTLYNSSTIQAVAGQPDGSSILCLSCHDGTIALGNILSRNNRIDFNEGTSIFNRNPSNLTTDLSDDHMISFEYNSSLAYRDGGLKDPMQLNHPVTLEKGKVQCTSCHDPHSNKFDQFLVVSNQFSSLCISCHDKKFWESSVHKTSSAKWNGSGTNPWFHTEYERVDENGCENCHNTHSAEGHDQLMKYRVEENNCLDCHNGNVSDKNIQAQLNKAYGHNVYATMGLHDANEDPLVFKMHAECADCHNPHAVNDHLADAPYINGSNIGVKGINQYGIKVDEVQYEYEICFRCHSDSPNKSGSNFTRQIEQNNTRLEFETGNPSFHPVVGIGTNSNVPSLIHPYSVSSMIYCTDCHSSNGKNSPRGPHGSIYPHILKFNYSTGDNIRESYQAYELCYQCHDRNKIISEFPNEFQSKVHKKHISDNLVSCSVCHDSHGISNLQGNSINNSNLINFDISIVKPVNGILRFEDSGLFSGNCYLSCHGVVHNPKSYN